jgi:sterol 3beta-glucosyltransferase
VAPADQLEGVGRLREPAEKIHLGDTSTVAGCNTRITILTYGSRGDVEPCVALGAGLKNAGFTVRLAAPAQFASLVRAHDLELVPIEGNPDALAQAFADRAGLSWPLMVVRMIQHVLPLAESAFRAAERAASDADLIVHSFLMTDAGHTLATVRGVPDVSAQFFPVFLPTSAFPAVALPDLPLGGIYRRGTHALNAAMFRYGGRLLYRRVRAFAPDLPDLAPWPFHNLDGGVTPILFAYSPHILPRPPDWPPQAHVTGYWHLPPRVGWEPSDALASFLESGPPPVYFGPGSMRTEKLRTILDTVITSVRARGQRAFLGVSPQVLGGKLGGPDVFAAEGVPHAWLFPRMRYILHHGGAGTTGAAAAAGVPNTAVPFSADQAFWARLIHGLGVGPASPPATRLSRELMDNILIDALSNPAYRRNAESLARGIRQEDGVALALRVIQAQLCLACGQV